MVRRRRVCSAMVLQILSGRFSGADRTAAFFCSRAGIDSCQPLVAVGAAPPDPLCAAGQYLVRFQRCVFRRMPLGSHQGLHRLQIVEAGQHPPIGAVGTAGASARPNGDGTEPLMSPAALPPDLFVAADSDLFRCQRAVLLRMPLLCQNRIVALQVVFPRNDQFSGADRAAMPLHAGVDGRLPLVSPVADPPDPPGGAAGHLTRLQIAVFLGCHCFARVGAMLCRSFSPGITTRLVQMGQPQPSIRALTRAFHSCPWAHCHQTVR